MAGLIRKISEVIILALLAVLLLTACRQHTQADENVTEKDIGGKTYIWEKEGFGGDFAIALYDDGTFEYYEGGLSSYIGSGKRSLDKGVVTLDEDDSGYGFSFRFAVKSGDLVYLSEGSDSFIYTKVEDGDRFVQSEKQGVFSE